MEMPRCSVGGAAPDFRVRRVDHPTACLRGAFRCLVRVRSCAVYEEQAGPASPGRAGRRPDPPERGGNQRGAGRPLVRPAPRPRQGADPDARRRRPGNR